ncbi:MAG: phospho-sugar mutase [Candidatus Improbicoccus devescovinae]|nr:MAG: phospho-sugar mutase [Candidatus Improbicoccus devescovinae]
MAGFLKSQKNKMCVIFMKNSLDIEKEYETWLIHSRNNTEIYEELLKIKNNKLEIYDRFRKNIDFGTAGIRGILGAGPNRVNVYVISLVSQAVSEYIISQVESPSVVIAYDTRKNSYLFARSAAEVFAANGFLVWIFEEVQPTPLLSYAVRALKCSTGIIVTASHNSFIYNGYKIYDSHGAQVANTSEIYKKMSILDIFNDVKSSEFNENLKNKTINYVPIKIIKNYINSIINLCNINKYFLDLKISYSPLNGCAQKIVSEISQKINIKEFNIVKEQQEPDEYFTTCRNPNPEKLKSFDLVIDLAKKTDSDLAILNDPDGDRVGIAVKHNSEYKILNGNEVAALILDFLLIFRENNNKNYVIKSMVSGGLIDKIAEENNIFLIETPSGFKNIAKFILELEKQDKLKNFLFAFEESQGYLLADYNRDKDGITSMFFICKMAGYYKQKNMNLIDVLYNLYEKYGYFLNKTLYFKIENSSFDTTEIKFKNIIKNSENLYIKNIYNHRNSVVYDLENNKILDINSPKTDMIVFNLENNQKLIVRASGTEPVIKCYVFANDSTLEKSKRNFHNIKKFAEDFIKNFFI